MKQLYDLLESLLDDEFDINDSSVASTTVKALVLELIDMLAGDRRDPKVKKQFEKIQEAVQTAALQNIEHKRSVMRRLRSKESTAVIFREIANKDFPYLYEIEVRRFLQNPRPEAIEIKLRRPDNIAPNGELSMGWRHKVNHINQLSPQIAKNVCFLDDDAFEQICQRKDGVI